MSLPNSTPKYVPGWSLRPIEDRKKCLNNLLSLLPEDQRSSAVTEIASINDGLTALAKLQGLTSPLLARDTKED